MGSVARSRAGIIRRCFAVAPLYHIGSAYVQKDYVKRIEKHQFGGIYTYKNAYIANE